METLQALLIVAIQVADDNSDYTTRAKLEDIYNDKYKKVD